MGPIRCPETSVKDYHSTLRNIPEERRSDYVHALVVTVNYCVMLNTIQLTDFWLTNLDQDSKWVHPEQKTGKSQLRKPASFLLFLTFWGSKDSSVSVVTKLRDGLSRHRGSVLSTAKILPRLQNVHTGSGAHQASYSMATGCSFSGIKVAVVWRGPYTCI
jgi:hypothetical protein